MKNKRSWFGIVILILFIGVVFQGFSNFFKIPEEKRINNAITYLTASNSVAADWNPTWRGINNEDGISSAGTEISPINISNDSDFSLYDSGGNGQFETPWIIENYVINASGYATHGIHIQNTEAHFILRNCTITNTDPGYSGIFFHNVTNCNMIGNYINHNAGGGVVLNYRCTYITLSNNKACHNLGTGIFINGNSDNNIITDNNVSYNGVHGIYLANSEHNTINNNLAYHNSEVGFYIGGLGHNSLTRNIAKANEVGIQLLISHYNIISSNTANANYGGIVIAASDFNFVTYNLANYNDFIGIYLAASPDNNEFDNNTITFNGDYGIYSLDVSEPNNCIFSGNLFCLNNNGSYSVPGNNIWSGNIFNPSTDLDADGLLSIDEIYIDTNPFLSDSDIDNLDDGFEVGFGTNPLVVDTDGDGLNDFYEVFLSSTNPINPDTDGDELLDGDEVYIYFTNPILWDTDSDGLSDSEEIGYATNPLYPDSDYDDLNDGFEVNFGTDPLNSDTDGDGFLDSDEITQGTNPVDRLDYPGKPTDDNLIPSYHLSIIGFTSLLIILLLIILLLFYKIRRKRTLA